MRPWATITASVLGAGLLAAAGSVGSRQVAGFPVFAWAAALAFGLQWLAFLPAWWRRTERFYDLAGSVGHLAVVGFALAASGWDHPRSLLLFGLIAVWALRLGTFLTLRIRRAGEDRRFRRLKQSFPAFLATWTLQGLWVFATDACALAAIGGTRDRPLGVLAAVGAALFALGFALEVVADWQKSVFARRPANRERFIDTGVFAWCRHPNYLGEILLWIGIAVIALPELEGPALLTLVSPVFVWLLLTRVSGIPLLEARGRERWGSDPAWQRYLQTTPRLLPRWLARSRGRHLSALLLAAAVTSPARGEVLLLAEGNRLWLVEVRAAEARRTLVIERATPDGEGEAQEPGGQRGRDVNGMLCWLPDGSGRFVLGEDTGQPARPPGWGIFTPGGRQVGRLVATYRVLPGEPYGCAFDAAGRLFTTDVGNKGFGAGRGQLLLWFPPFGRFPPPAGAEGGDVGWSSASCKLDTGIRTAGAVVVDARGRVYVASASGFAILRYSPPFPTGPGPAGGCAGRDELGSPRADRVTREVFVRGPYVFTGLALSGDRLFASSPLTGEIAEYDLEGRHLRDVLDPPGLLPPHPTGSPMGFAVGSDGTLYYTDLDLVWDGWRPVPGPNGKLWRIRFDPSGVPRAPELLLDGLAFPDGVAVVPPEFVSRFRGAAE